jgi:hypothetical protein
MPASDADSGPTPSHGEPSGVGPGGRDDILELGDADLLEDVRHVMQRRTATGAQRADTTDSLVGKRIEQYRVAKLLGEGGIACVYRALDADIGLNVALKVLKPRYRGDTDLCARFEREARSMARVQHENVVRILGFPQYGEMRAIVMELVTGGSVARRLQAARKRHALLALEDVRNVIVQAAHGIDAAHALGIIHRDVKPSNLLLDSEGRTKVADFGVIATLDEASWLTGVGQQIGTPGYMSPEQCKGEPVTLASDVYALGVTLFELLTGRLPFEVEAESPFAMMLRHISAVPPDPCTLRADVPESLSSVVLRCMAKRPEDRFATAGSFADVLSRCELHRVSRTMAAPAEAEAEPAINVRAVRDQLKQLPLRAIVCWACRCARRVQGLNDDPRLERALQMAEHAITEPHDDGPQHSVTRVLSKFRQLRAASLSAAYAEEDAKLSPPAKEAGLAAAAAAACATARCIDDAAADAAYAARRAVGAFVAAGKAVPDLWQAARWDFQVLASAGLGQPGTVGRAVPPGLLDPVR